VIRRRRSLAARIVAAFDRRYPRAVAVLRRLPEEERRLAEMVRMGTAAPALRAEWEQLYRRRWGRPVETDDEVAAETTRQLEEEATLFG